MKSGKTLAHYLFFAVMLPIPGIFLAEFGQAKDADLLAPAATGAAEKLGPKPQQRNPMLLKYGDGKADGKKSIAGAGEMIRFAMPENASRVRGLKVHGSRYGHPQAPKEDIEITLLSEDMLEVLHTELVPYAIFKRGKNRWTNVRFKEAVEVPTRFWVVLQFHAERTKGVYVSYDTSTKGQHSRIGSDGEDVRKTDFKGDWMVRALLAK